jgi:acyl-CoA synthetase (AMP-forming)/AMP-acid ligase II
VNLVDLFVEQAARHPQRVALVCNGTSVSYAQLLARSTALAQRLAADGLRRGQAALPLQGVGIPLYVTLIALFRLGATAVFPEPASGLRGVRAAARSVAVDALVGDWRRRLLRLALPELRHVRICVSPDTPYVEGAPGPVDLPENAPALITFTIGSTGRAKAIVRSHGFLLQQHRQLSAVLQPQDGDVALTSLPMFILCNLGHGATSIIPDCNLRRPRGADPRPLIGQIERYRVNRLILPPALCERLAQSGAILNGVEQVFTGGGPVFPNLLRKLSGLAPNAGITAVYGSSEAEPIAHVSLDEIGAQDFAAMCDGAGLLAGAPVEGVDVRIEDDEIWVSGNHVVTGYLNPADDAGSKRSIAGRIWHRTGDAGRIDACGRLWLLGRHKSRCGGMFPFAVESAARCVPGVRNAALLNIGAANILAVETDQATPPRFPQGWAQRWPEALTVMVLPRIPMDFRHNSKVDYGQLREMLGHCNAPGRRRTRMDAGRR